MDSQKIPTKREIKEEAHKFNTDDIKSFINRKPEIQAKMEKIDRNIFPKLCNQVQLFSSMLEDHVDGAYPNFNHDTVGSAVVALKYFLSPGDYIPDSANPAGYFDDVEVASQVMISSQQEIEEYIKWKGLNVKDYY